MKATILATSLVALTALAAVAIAPFAAAEPNMGPFEPWVSYKVTKSGLHIAKDPLFDPNNFPAFMDPSAQSLGFIVYSCVSEKPQNNPTSFDYSLSSNNLAPTSHYTVKAYPTFELDYNTGEIIYSSDYGVVESYTLGTLHTNGQGEGELRGSYDLNGPAPYAWTITIELDGVAVLESHPDDPIGFFIMS